MDVVQEHPESLRRRILAVVTTGGFTHAAPVLEICAVLAGRGHSISFATNQGQESWVSNYPFIKTVHTFGKGPTADEYEAHYQRMVASSPADGIGPIMKSKYLWDSQWPDEYTGLKSLCTDATTKPDFIIADFFVDVACKDMMAEFNIPLAVVYPQMPFLMAPCSYIPGEPGFQTEIVLTSEHASFMTRLRNELVVPAALPTLLRWMRRVSAMRRRHGVTRPTMAGPKPNYLVLVNSFFGLEAPKDLPPLLVPVGPVLADTWPPLDEAHATFLAAHERVMYVALGTHVVLPRGDMEKVLRGLVGALDAGHVDGVIWSMGVEPRGQLDRRMVVERKDGRSLSVAALLDGKESEFLVPLFAPQRAVLDHPNLKLYLTHGGGSSANEVLWHGKPVLTLGFFFDQLCNSVRLLEAGVGMNMDKMSFTAAEIVDKIGKIVADEDGRFARNVERMKRIARISAKRKHLAADMVEEVLYDHELRFDGEGKETSPMHLETADRRMPVWKAKNWDVTVVMVGGFVGLPLAVGGFAARMLWLHRALIARTVKGYLEK